MAKQRRSKANQPIVCDQNLTMITPPSPIYQVDWRWQRALLGVPLAGDCWSQRLDGCTSNFSAGADTAGQHLRSGDPILSNAYEIYTGDALRRAEIEARILANQSSMGICQRMQLAIDVIDAYEALFFDVRRNLKCESWVRTCCLKFRRAALDQRLTVPDLWRTFGFEYGAAMVDALTSSIDRDLLTREGVVAYLEPGVRLPVAVRRGIAVEIIPPPQTVEQIVHQKILKDSIRSHGQSIRASLVKLEAPLTGKRRSRRSYGADDAIVARIRKILKTQA